MAHTQTRVRLTGSKSFKANELTNRPQNMEPVRGKRARQAVRERDRRKSQ